MGWGKASVGAKRLAVGERAHEGLPYQQRRALHADATQPHELLDHSLRSPGAASSRTASRWRSSVGDLGQHQLKAVKHALDPGPCLWRQRIPQCGSHALKPLPAVSPQRIVAPSTERGEDRGDSVHDGYPLTQEILSLADATPRILVGLGWDRHHRAHARLSAQPCQQCPQQQFGIDPVGLRAARTAVDRNAGRLDDEGVHTRAAPATARAKSPSSPPRKPAPHDPRSCPPSSRGPGSIRLLPAMPLRSGQRAPELASLQPRHVAATTQLFSLTSSARIRVRSKSAAEYVGCGTGICVIGALPLSSGSSLSDSPLPTPIGSVGAARWPLARMGCAGGP